MNLKPLIKVLKLFLLKAVSVFLVSRSGLPQGCWEEKCSQPAERGDPGGRSGSGAGVNGSPGQPRPLEQRAGRSQPRHDKWLCRKTEREPKPIGTKKRKKKKSTGCVIERSPWKWTPSSVIVCEAQHGYARFCMDTAITLSEVTLTGKTDFFPPNNFIVSFFFVLFSCLMVLFFQKLYRGKSDWSWAVRSSCSYFTFYKTASEQISFAYMLGNCKELFNRH